MAWTVVMSPSTIPKLSWMTLARGARQLVVQLAFETTFMLESYSSSLTPITNMGASGDGAETMTFFAPPFIKKVKTRLFTAKVNLRLDFLELSISLNVKHLLGWNTIKLRKQYSSKKKLPWSGLRPSPLWGKLRWTRLRNRLRRRPTGCCWGPSRRKLRSSCHQWPAQS